MERQKGWNTDKMSIDSGIVEPLKMSNFTFNKLTVAKGEFVKLFLGVLKIISGSVKFCYLVTNILWGEYTAWLHWHIPWEEGWGTGVNGSSSV
jgi:hypothetical protein